MFRSPNIIDCNKLAAVLVVLSISGSGLRAADSPGEIVGRKIESFALRDIHGQQHTLEDYAGKPVLVVAFLGTECPLAKLYTPRLVELAAQLADRDVAFVAIDSNQQDSLAKMQHFAKQHELNFPLLKDGDSRVADRFGAERTPQAYVLNAQREICYAGRIDDQYGIDRGVSYQKPRPQQRDLAMAIEDVLAGRAVATPLTEVAGCIIGRPKQPKADSPVTYSNQIARIFQKHCVDCHRPGEIGPFPLLTYDDAVGWGEMLLEVVQEKRMPPWGASPEHGRFLNDISLPQEAVDQIAQWVENGCPEGDPSELPAPREFIEGWGISQPDQVVRMSDTPFEVPAEGTVEYQYFVVDPGWKEDVWVKATEARPGNREVVHHIIVFVKEPGTSGGMMGPHGIGPNDLLVGYAPGTPPMRGHHGMARKIKAGSKLVFQMHYTPNGRPQKDLSSIGLVYADPAEVTHDVRSGAAMQLNLDIPPGADNHMAVSRRKFRNDMLLISLMPHMHLRGKSFRYELEYPDGTRETLLHVPRYDFNWQLVYILDEPKLMPAGSTLHGIAHYDNSAENLANPDPTQRVRWGDQTWEEMMIGWYVATELEPDEKPQRSKRTASNKLSRAER